ncbi:hypothetical protein HGRIS_000547 [Hohenbuehelia grisea]|uniref:Uncharacterized protein n=1 Tax=Hohenbuehelia grisea TaxID=104357 RepID=A0ABR3JTD8_9AGAR
MLGIPTSSFGTLFLRPHNGDMSVLKRIATSRHLSQNFISAYHCTFSKCAKALRNVDRVEPTYWALDKVTHTSTTCRDRHGDVLAPAAVALLQFEDELKVEMLMMALTFGGAVSLPLTPVSAHRVLNTFDTHCILIDLHHTNRSSLQTPLADLTFGDARLVDEVYAQEVLNEIDLDYAAECRTYEEEPLTNLCRKGTFVFVCISRGDDGRAKGALILTYPIAHLNKILIDFPLMPACEFAVFNVKKRISHRLDVKAGRVSGNNADQRWEILVLGQQVQQLMVAGVGKHDNVSVRIHTIPLISTNFIAYHEIMV